MARARAKSFEYSIAVDRDGAMTAGGAGEVALDEAWSPDHLLLAALVRCSLKSLAYHAGRAGSESVGGGTASGTITKPEGEERYRFVEIECRLDVEITPPPEDVADLLAKGERDCFVSASLTVAPRYCWTVNGEQRW